MESLDLSVAFDREHLQHLLINNLKKLCHKKVSFKSKLSIEGLLGLTVDDTTVQLISIKEILHNGVGLRNSPSDKLGSDSECPIKSSRSRRKSKVTRKAVVNFENDCGIDLNEDWNIDNMDHDAEVDPCETPLNLVKWERSDHLLPSVPEDENQSGFSASSVMEDKPELNEPVTGLDSSSTSRINHSTVRDRELHMKLKHSWNYPVSNVRKYGSYGYMINHGSDVMFSCNQCPKMFRNRVSLWRHGVKHKMSQGSATSKAQPSNSWLSTLRGMVDTQSHNAEQYYSAGISKGTGYPLGLSNKFQTFQSSHITHMDGSHNIGNSVRMMAPAFQEVMDTQMSSREVDNHPSLKGTVMSSEHVNGDIRTESSENNNNDSESNAEKTSNSSSSTAGDNMELDIHIPGSSGGTTQDVNTAVSPLCDDVRVKADDQGSGSSVLDLKAAEAGVKVGLLPVISGDESNMRLVSGYGYVVDTANGKLYKCISCLKSFKNRVSLWKHQLKHQ